MALVSRSGAYALVAAALIAFAYSVQTPFWMPALGLVVALGLWERSPACSSLLSIVSGILLGPVGVAATLALLASRGRLGLPRRREWGPGIAWALAGGVACGVVAVRLDTWRTRSGWSATRTSVEQLLDWLHEQVGPAVLLVACLAALAALNAIVEELVFREFLIRACVLARFPIWASVSVSATAFALAHVAAGVPGGPLGFAATFAFGVAASFLRLRTRTGLVGAIALHAGADFSIFVLLTFNGTILLAR